MCFPGSTDSLLPLGCRRPQARAYHTYMNILKKPLHEPSGIRTNMFDDTGLENACEGYAGSWTASKNTIGEATVVPWACPSRMSTRPSLRTVTAQLDKPEATFVGRHGPPNHSGRIPKKPDMPVKKRRARHKVGNPYNMGFDSSGSLHRRRDCWSLLPSLNLGSPVRRGTGIRLAGPCRKG